MAAPLPKQLMDGREDGRAPPTHRWHQVVFARRVTGAFQGRQRVRPGTPSASATQAVTTTRSVF